MKTIIITLLISMLAVQPVAFGRNIELINAIGDEAYVDDIPFNTESIAAAYFESMKQLGKGKMSEEEYVDDIPVSTSSVAFTYVMESLMQDDKTCIDLPILSLMQDLISGMIMNEDAEISLGHFAIDTSLDELETEVDTLLQSSTKQSKFTFRKGITD